jgi:hypothetical protein
MNFFSDTSVSSLPVGSANPRLTNAEDKNVNPIEKWITWNEPNAKFFCNTNEYEVGIGQYGCGYAGCKQGARDDCVNSIWIPPNKYAYVYTNYQKIGGSQVGNIYNKVGDGSFTLLEDNTINSEFCKNNGSVVVTSADYSRADGVGGPNSVLSRAKNTWEGCTGTDCAKFGGSADMNGRFGDKFPGHTKKLTVTYDCIDKPSVISAYPPDTIMGPGYYKHTNIKGKYDDMVPKNIPYYDRLGKGIDEGVMDTHVIIQNRPWKDHIRDCCFNGLDYELCGKFAQKKEDGSPNRDQGASCSSFLSECTISDIKTQPDGKPGKCQFICQQDPKSCDAMKRNYCKDNPDSTWCDCINAEDRQEYQDKKASADYYKVSVPSKVCLMGRCTSGQDLEDIFITSDLFKDVENSNQCPAPSVYQKIDVSGSKNVLDLSQTSNATFGTGDHTSGSQSADVSGHDISGNVEQQQEINTGNVKSSSKSSAINSQSDVTTKELDPMRSKSSSTGLSNVEIALIVISSVTFFGILIGLIVYFSGQKNENYGSYPYASQPYVYTPQTNDYS